MNWKIESYKTDVAEISSNDHQPIYTVNVINENNNIVASKEAYGNENLKTVTNQMIARYGQYIAKIEHNG
tara:strand:+ start:466 stop:675 length:210 start_codon:yes stop_codon:yes gene_type:complete